MKKLLIPILIAVVALLAVVLVVLIVNKDQPVSFGSISTGQEYTATTTPSGTGAWTDQTIKRGWGSLGSIIITKAGDTEFVLYDATSTNVLTTGFGTVGTNTTTQQLARIPENLAAGTYIFDVTFTKGLVIDVLRGTTGSSTITFR